MIKIFLKHWIYEKCIDALFQGISRNFGSSIFEFKIGDRYNHLSINEYREIALMTVDGPVPLVTIFDDVEIMDINRTHVVIGYRRSTTYHNEHDIEGEGTESIILKCIPINNIMHYV